MRIPRRHGASACVRHANSDPCISSEETLPDIEPKVTARYRSKGYNGSNSHPKAGLSWPLAYP
jgi:hypothetical protein